MPQHETDHAEAEEGKRVHGQVLEVFGEPSAAPKPRERPLDDPALRQGHEAHAMAAANDLQSPAAGAGYRGRGGHTLVGAIGEDHLDERKQPARGAQ